MENTSHQNKNHTILAFFAGITTAIAAGSYFLYGPRGRENREKISRWVKRAKREILVKMEEVEDLTEEKYHDIVDEVVNRYAQMKHVGKEKAATAASKFKDKWEDMRDMVAEAREEAEMELAEEDRE